MDAPLGLNDALGSLGALETVGAAIAAMSALGLASFALVDSSKAFWGGVSNVGFKHIVRGCAPFGSVLDVALGGAGYNMWVDLLRAQWRNGRSKDEQKALVRALVRQGMTIGDPSALAKVAGVSSERLLTISAKLSDGAELEDADISLLGRVDTSIGMHIDAAYERADQQYRNVARVCAAFVAIALSMIVAYAMEGPVTEYFWPALVAGVLAVPIAPVAKDLITALTAATRAVQATRNI